MANQPKSRRGFWAKKFEYNKRRDRDHERALQDLGWTVCTIWECETKNSDELTRQIRHFLQ
jgi:DNA mismatch endonuclease (patch repair protein)